LFFLLSVRDAEKRGFDLQREGKTFTLVARPTSKLRTKKSDTRDRGDRRRRTLDIGYKYSQEGIAPDSKGKRGDHPERGSGRERL
jgi:hypothetical protein